MTDIVFNENAPDLGNDADVDVEGIVRDLRQRAETAEARARNLETALHLSQAKISQLEANVTALRTQRDSAIEREADALVDYGIVKSQSDSLVSQHKRDMEQLKSTVQPMQSKLHQTQVALNEVREKFGAVKHEQKAAERRVDEHHEMALDAQDREQTACNALAWYMEVTRSIKYSVPGRFLRNTKTKLTAEHLVVAYKASRDTKRVMRANQFNLVEFIINANVDAGTLDND